MRLAPSPATVPLGLTVQLHAWSAVSGGGEEEVTGSAIWSSADPSVVAVSNDVGSRGVVQGKSSGTTTITAQFGDEQATVEVTASDALVESIALDPAGPMSVGRLGTVQFKVVATLSDQSKIEVTDQATWATSASGIVTVEGGWAIARGAGPATVTATYGEKTATADFRVKEEKLTSITVKPTAVTLFRNQTVELTATGKYEDSTTEDVTGGVNWKSGVNSITLSHPSPGTTVAKGVSETAASVTAVDPLQASVAGSATITVRPLLSGLALSSSSDGKLLGGTSATVVLSFTGYDYGGQATVTLSSSNPSLVAVPATATGNFTITTSPVASEKTVTITASYQGIQKTLAVTLRPPQVTALTLSNAGGRFPTNTVYGGLEDLSGAVQLETAAPSGGVAFTLTSSVPAAVQLPTVIVPAGETHYAFRIPTVPVNQSTTVVITATPGNAVSASYTQLPALSNLSCTQESGRIVGTLTLSTVPSVDKVVVTLESSNTDIATPPASLTFFGNATTDQTFTVTRGIASGTVTLRAAYGDSKVSCTMNVR